MSSSKDRRSSRIERGAERLGRLATPLPEVVIGVVAAVGAKGLRVDWPGNPAGTPVSALAAAVLDARAVGREAALLFAGGDASRPIVVGLVREPAPDAPADDKRLVFEAGREIVLRCGPASITLTRAGKILIRGAYVSSRASGVQRIKGASVQIN